MTEVMLYGEVGWDFDARWLSAALDGADDEVTLRVHSPGGDVFEGVAISNSIRRARAAGRRVTAVVDGLCASAASYMCLTADRVLAGPGAVFMVHPPSGGCYGTAEDMRGTARALEACEDSILSLYEARTGRSPEQIRAAMRDETWMGAGDAVAFGLADGMDEGPAPDLSGADSKWAGLSGSAEYAAFASRHGAMASSLGEYAAHSALFRDRLREARENDFGPVRDTRRIIPSEDECDRSGEAPEAGRGEAPRLFSDGWDVYRIRPKEVRG